MDQKVSDIINRVYEGKAATYEETLYLLDLDEAVVKLNAKDFHIESRVLRD